MGGFWLGHLAICDREIKKRCGYKNWRPKPLPHDFNSFVGSDRKSLSVPPSLTMFTPFDTGFFTQVFFHANMFAHGFYVQFFFVAYAQRLLHRNMWHKHTYKHSNIFFPVNVWFLRHRVFHTHAHKHTRACSFRQILLLTRRCFYTDAFTHKKVCTHKCL